MIVEMETLKNVASWAASELRVLWCLVCFLAATLVNWIQFQIPSMKARHLAELNERARMQSFSGNWQVTQ